MCESRPTGRGSWWARWRDWIPLGALTIVVLAGGLVQLTGHRTVADATWAAATLAALVVALRWTVQSVRRRRVGVDVIAVLALIGALLAGEPLAGAVVALMLATGHTLETYARRRAQRDLQALVAHAPRTARRRAADGTVDVVDVDDVATGDQLVVGPGEVVPVDGVAEDPATCDESVVTGESQAVHRAAGDRIASGVVNAGSAFGLRAVETAQASTYAGIVRMAAEAGAGKAATVRLADRYAAAFVPFTLALAGAGWIVSGEFVRAVAVLVVATPCPLLLATPVAVVAGLSRAARRGVLVRDGGALEQLGHARTLLVDKTGTLTTGRPETADVVTGPDGGEPAELLRLAASVEQLSPHVLAGAVVRAARGRGLRLVAPTEVTEDPGRGVQGRVDGRTVRVGQPDDPLPDWAGAVRDRTEADGLSTVWITVDDVPAGVVLLRDPVRPDAAATVTRLRQAGFTRLVMLTGDRPEVARQVAAQVGVDDVVARCSPQEKTTRVREESAHAVTVMVGDGVNDAPALAAADVGVAVGGSGASAAAGVADAVLAVDELGRLADAVDIARRSRRIAVQSAAVGMGLAVVAMVVAAFGLLPPVAGAFTQEGIDVAVILNALRALHPGGRRRPRRR
ncbi:MULTISPECIES: heavy metal translocating P-type ATPase [unclassified Solwaraspora]|uniref:heavy metal translocating P-type ATPase n=1 Tax=unclassified Solwaraspora TaxID=2627926 RepID=UPI00259B7825|nr:heavy metal translocating P-type ATPase [Solwaraspora sp. WMMA2056]WJK43578.1 heavy metal translocating P-type ATPase [Solwaraspora sp. WMMA2056]